MRIIRVVLNSLFFFTKRFRTHQKYQKAPKVPKVQKAQKAQKAQKRNQAKVENATSEQKLEMRLKNIWVEKSNSLAYLRFCVFCAREEKKTENKKMKSLYNVMY